MTPPPAHRRTASASTPRRRAQILVVDDNEDTRELVRRTLQAHGYVVIVACDGKEALALLLDHASPDLIVLDLLMPVMGGAELIEILGCYQRLAAIPLVIMSGRPASSVQGRHHTRYLRKPFEITDLECKVEELLALAARRG